MLIIIIMIDEYVQFIISVYQTLENTYNDLKYFFYIYYFGKDKRAPIFLLMLAGVYGPLLIDSYSNNNTNYPITTLYIFCSLFGPFILISYPLLMAYYLFHGIYHAGYYIS
jgi:hypothetical protein